MKTYTYKAKHYDNLYDLSEALGVDGVFIPRTISDTDLKELGCSRNRRTDCKHPRSQNRGIKTSA